MANGADTDEFTMVSGSRSGMKRELAFALKANTEMDESIGRTRGRKSQIETPGNEFEEILSNKRFKINEDESVVGKEDIVMQESKKSHADEKSGFDFDKLANDDTKQAKEVKADLTKSGVVGEVERDSLVDGEKVVKEDGIVVQTPQENENELLKSPSRRPTPYNATNENRPMRTTQSDDLEKSAREGSISPDMMTYQRRGHKKFGLEKSAIAEKAKLVREQINSSETPVVINDNCETPTDVTGKGARRFTRSVLKPKDEPMEMDTSSGSSGVSEDAWKDDGKSLTVVSSMKTPSKNKLEMKMSKKIDVTKFPTTVRELLDTGLLEGLNITYVFKNSKRPQRETLHGVIRERGALCFCTSCNGSNVVSLYEFEKHAGSSYKHPSENIYLENGNSLRDVLHACRGAPLDTLESTIKNCIGSSPEPTCQSCRGHLPSSRTAKSMLLCNSCLASNNPEESSPRTTVSSARFSKATVPFRSSDSASKAIAPLRSSDSASKFVSLQNKSSKGKLTRKDLRLHKLVFEEDGLPDGTELGYYVRGKKLLEGYKKGFGIFCRCCDSVVSASSFEAHAGWATRRKPYLNIYTSNGVSLHELSVSLSRGRKFSPCENDDLCSICADFGELLLCDGCPRAFHQDCVGMSSLPRGKWYCKYCLSMYEREKACQYNENAKAAGRIDGVDPIEQITKRCIRIVETFNTEAGGCVLCRKQGFCKSGFGPQTVILCDQCENEYHVGCLKDHNMADLKELPDGSWFCCVECNMIHTALQKLVAHGEEKLTDPLMSIIKRKQNNVANIDIDVRWRVLSGKMASSPENKLLLSKAVSIFHERFDPIVDAKTGRDLIPSMVYGRNIRDQEFGGMYCALLTVNSSVVSAGIIRIFGREFAELPLVATTTDYQGQGYFQALFSCIELLLGFLSVKYLVLPAAEEAESIWTNKFGFKKMTQDELSGLKQRGQVMIFQGTSMLQKSVPKCRILSKAPKNS